MMGGGAERSGEKSGARAAAKLAAEAAKQQALASAKSEPNQPPRAAPGAIPARLEIARKTQRVEFDLSALEHPVELQPILSVEDHQDLLRELLPKNGVIKAANLIPEDDDIERSYMVELWQSGSSGSGANSYLVVHLLEHGGIEHVTYFYKSRGDGNFQWFAGNFANDAQTWEFDRKEHDRLLAAAETCALERQLQLEREASSEAVIGT